MINITTQFGKDCNVLISEDISGMYSIIFEQAGEHSIPLKWKMNMNTDQFWRVYEGMRRFIIHGYKKEYINADYLMKKLIEKYSDGEGATEYDRAINDALDIINNMVEGD